MERVGAAGLLGAAVALAGAAPLAGTAAPVVGAARLVAGAREVGLLGCAVLGCPVLSCRGYSGVLSCGAEPVVGAARVLGCVALGCAALEVPALTGPDGDGIVTRCAGADGGGTTAAPGPFDGLT